MLARHFHAPAALQRRVTLDPIDLVLLHQELDTLGMLGDDLVLPVDDLRVIHARLFADESFFVGVQEPLPHVRRMQQRFGWNTAHVQARATQFRIFLDNGGLQPVLSGAHRRGIPARTTPDNNQIVRHFSHSTYSKPAEARISEAPKPI